MAQDAAVIAEEKGLKQVTDTGALAAAIDQVLAANPDKLAEYKAGKEKLFGYFVGQVTLQTHFLGFRGRCLPHRPSQIRGINDLRPPPMHTSRRGTRSAPVGVMKATQGKANPALINELLKQKL